MSCINFFLTPLPDETLYSLAARYHFLSGNSTASDTCEALFGNHESGLLHDFPCGINFFCQSTGCMEGNALEILRKLTMLPYFEPFVPMTTITLVKEALLRNHSGNLKFLLRLPPSQVDVTHPLKACRACILNDISSSGFSYWHRTHQLPGVMMCPEHRCPLIVLRLKVNRLSKRQYLLPTDIDQAQPILEAEIIHKKNQTLLLELAITAQHLLHADLPSLETMTIRETYRCGLKQHGWLSKNGNVRQQEFQKAFVSHYAPISDMPYFAKFISSAGSQSSWLSALVCKLRSSKHPLKHLLLIAFLFDDMQHFIKCYRSSDASCHPPLTPTPLKIKKSDEQNMLSTLAELLVKQKMSLRKAARIMGLSVSTLSIKAACANIPIKRPNQKNDDPMRNTIRDALLKGTSLRQVQDDYNLSYLWLYRYLQSNPKILQVWKLKYFEIKRDKKRAHFLLSIKALPILSRKTIMQSLGTGFKWLYRNDKKWLEAHLPDPISKNMIRKPRVDWAVRDEKLALEISTAACLLKNTIAKPRRLSKTTLFRFLPELGKKSTCLTKMPLASIALQQSVESKDAYRLRRLQWARQKLEVNEGAVKSYQVRRLAGIQGEDEGTYESFNSSKE